MWNFDMSEAPRGYYEVVNRKVGNTTTDVKVYRPERVILASKCGKVTLSYYIPDEKRWCMFAHGENPVAWIAWPEHPNPSTSSQTDSAGASNPLTSVPAHNSEAA